MRKLLIILFTLISLSSYSQIVADHRVIDEFDQIPANWIDSVKTMLLGYIGESHSLGTREGFNLLETSDATYQAQVGWTPAAYTDAYLRVFGAYWGDVDNASGWVFTLGEEDWYQSTLGISRIKAGLTYINETNGTSISAFGFGWCYDPAETAIDMADYIAATEEYIDYCVSNDYPTKVFFTTGPVDGENATGSQGYYKYLAYETIRDSVLNDTTRILFDYADILCYDSSDGEPTTTTWDGHTYPIITTTNLGDADVGHIGVEGQIKLAKAMWWLLARIAGWEGVETIYEADYYVATDGDDDNPGTYELPWATWQKAFNTADAGDTVYFRGGTWYPTDYYVGNSITIIAAKQIAGVYTGTIYGNDGTRENPICFFNYPGEVPILDCSQVDMTGHIYNNGIEIYTTDWLQFRGLTVRNVYQPTTPDPSWDNRYQIASGIGTYVCSNLTFENMTVNNIGGRGFSVSGTVGYFGIESDTTRWINCDAYNCIDSLSSVPGNAADGWKVNGEYNAALGYNTGGLWEFIGCRAWNCSDDGFDPSGSFQVIFDHCWAFYNGHYGPVLDGNGFKSGGVDNGDIMTYPTRIIKNCLAAYNTGIGIYDLEYPDYRRNNSRVYNNTIYKNGIGIQISSNVNYPNSLSVYNNNIIYGTINRDAGDRPYNLSVACFYTESNNSWDYGEPGSLPRWIPTDTVTVTDEDFISTDSTGLRGARQSDGSLPDLDFLKLAPTSDLIDAGTANIVDIGTLSFYGSAPDIGYAEYDGIDSTATDILTFTLPTQTGAATINTTNHTVAIEVAYTADITDLTPTITLSYGATIDPLSGVSQDFTAPVTYTVTALDEVTEQEWVVTVTQEEAPSTHPRPVMNGTKPVMYGTKMVIMS